jgi:phage host-nuclease inhibitor protein Gam
MSKWHQGLKLWQFTSGDDSTRGFTREQIGQLERETAYVRASLADEIERLEKVVKELSKANRAANQLIGDQANENDRLVTRLNKEITKLRVKLASKEAS